MAQQQAKTLSGRAGAQLNPLRFHVQLVHARQSKPTGDADTIRTAWTPRPVRAHFVEIDCEHKVSDADQSPDAGKVEYGWRSRGNYTPVELHYTPALRQL